MKDEWLAAEFSKQWDVNASTGKGNPTRPEQLDILTSIIANNYHPGNLILDLGFGSGQVEELIWAKKQNIKIVGVDSSEPMIELAKKRLTPHLHNLEIIKKNVAELTRSDVPKGTYQFALSVQVFHELTDSERTKLFKEVYSILEPGGSFLILDRIAIDTNIFSESYETIRNRLEDLSPVKSEKTYEEFRRGLAAKDDQVIPVERYVELLGGAGFKATILHLHLNRALIVGVKA
ncbi:MAG: class I SAM-dependent methyltransferase [Minisyncoccia bacterium]|jgi:ubiquinone/menaquinone biosynthesis C-methylase UbiE